jgi:tRNA threonylcarbamoyladenosine biosynthesis protein TsaE
MPILDSNSVEFISRSPDQTRRVGMRIGARLQTGDIICLVGELGSGKTTLVQGISAGWGSLDEATSPTFVLVNVYRRRPDLKLYHLDAYRLRSPVEAQELDLEQMIENGPLVIEWADRVLAILPEDYLTISFRTIDIEQRDLVFKARGNRSAVLLHSLSSNFPKQGYRGR